MRHAAVLSATVLMLAGALPASAQQSLTVHPQPRAGGNGGLEITIPPINNPNYLDYGPLPDHPGADHSQDYMNQAGGDTMGDSGPGSDDFADLLPDSDGAYDGPIPGTPF